MVNRKILVHAGEVFYGIYNKTFEENILRYIIKNPNITAEDLANTKISTSKNGNPKKTSNINAKCVAKKFIDVVKRFK